MSELSDLRAQVFDLAGHRCEWPTCGSTIDLQLAHLRHRGMGGSPKGAVNTISNTACLCLTHHRILDGEADARLRRYELRVLLDGYLRQTRGWVDDG